VRFTALRGDLPVTGQQGAQRVYPVEPPSARYTLHLQRGGRFGGLRRPDKAPGTTFA